MAVWERDTLTTMNLNELREGGGCPLCVGEQRSYTWSGADIGVAQILAGGAERIEAEADELGWPKTERARCKRCQAVWHFEFRWPDRPPLFLTGKVVEE